MYGSLLALPLQTPDSVIGVLTALRFAGREPTEVPLLTSFAEQATLVLEPGEKSRAQRELAVFADRDRIARDLHDHVVQRLFATGLQLQSTLRRIHDTAMQERIERAVVDLDTTIREIRIAIFDLAENPTSAYRRLVGVRVPGRGVGSTIVGRPLPRTVRRCAGLPGVRSVR
jgi:signal transduction histidine kinase